NRVRAGHAALGEMRRHDASLRRLGYVKALRVGAGLQEFYRAAGIATCDAEGVQQLVRRELQQAPGNCGRYERTADRSGLKAAHVETLRVHRRRRSGRHVVADDDRRQYLLSRGTDTFSDCERRWRYHA